MVNSGEVTLLPVVIILAVAEMEVTMKRAKLLLSISLILFGCSNEDHLDFGTTHQALSTQCTIILGGGGETAPPFTASFTDYTDEPYVANTGAWTFIRSTSGNCKFTVY